MIIIPLSVFLIGWSIRVSVLDIVKNEKDLNAKIFLSLPRESKYLMVIGLSLLLALFILYIIISKIKNYKKNNKLSLNKEDKKLYLLSFLNAGKSWAFTIIYYKAINDKIKININKEKDHISYTTKDNLHGEAGFKDFVKQLFIFQEKNIIQIKSTDPLSFKINKEYKDTIIDIYEN